MISIGEYSISSQRCHHLTPQKKNNFTPTADQAKPWGRKRVVPTRGYYPVDPVRWFPLFSVGLRLSFTTLPCLPPSRQSVSVRTQNYPEDSVRCLGALQFLRAAWGFCRIASHYIAYDKTIILVTKGDGIRRTVSLPSDSGSAAGYRVCSTQTAM
jgi:hypothetical protein